MDARQAIESRAVERNLAGAGVPVVLSEQQKQMACRPMAAWDMNEVRNYLQGSAKLRSFDVPSGTKVAGGPGITCQCHETL